MSHQLDHATLSDKVRILAFCPRTSRCKNLCTLWHSRNSMCLGCVRLAVQAQHRWHTYLQLTWWLPNMLKLNHWDICDTAHPRYSHTASKSESACLGRNIWDFLLSREISRMFNYLENKISRWKIRDLFWEKHNRSPQVNSCSLPSISGKDSWKIPQQFSLSIYLLLPIISTLLEHCGGQLWWKKCHWQRPLT